MFSAGNTYRTCQASVLFCVYCIFVVLFTIHQTLCITSIDFKRKCLFVSTNIRLFINKYQMSFHASRRVEEKYIIYKLIRHRQQIVSINKIIPCLLQGYVELRILPLTSNLTRLKLNYKQCNILRILSLSELCCSL